MMEGWQNMKKKDSYTNWFSKSNKINFIKILKVPIKWNSTRVLKVRIFKKIPTNFVLSKAQKTHFCFILCETHLVILPNFFYYSKRAPKFRYIPRLTL